MSKPVTYRFSFGPWNISEGGDPFGPDVRAAFPHDRKFALYKRLGFDGVVVSDDMEMRAISSRFGLEESVPAAVEAGIDLLCFGNNLTYDPDIASRAAAILERAVTSGRIPLSRINASHRRLLALKRRAGLIA